MSAAVCLCAAITAVSCGVWGSPDGVEGEPAVTPEAVSNIPFVTKEPDRYQADITVTAFDKGEPVIVRKYIVAKRGAELSITFEPGSERERRMVELEDGRTLIFVPGTGEYTEQKRGPGGNEAARELVKGWLTVTPGTKYEKLSTENGISRYKVSPEGLEGSETIVIYDENRKFPVGTEIYSLRDGKKELAFRYEVSNFRDEPDAGLFEIPENIAKAGS